jgi:hypothetical protein
MLVYHLFNNKWYQLRTLVDVFGPFFSWNLVQQFVYLTQKQNLLRCVRLWPELDETGEEQVQTLVICLSQKN